MGLNQLMMEHDLLHFLFKHSVSLLIEDLHVHNCHDYDRIISMKSDKN